MGIIVERAPADTPGSDVIDSALTTEAAMLERGRYECNVHAQDRIRITASLLSTAFVKPGSLAEVVGTRGTTKELVTSFSLELSLSANSSDLGVSTQIMMERPV